VFLKLSHLILKVGLLRSVSNNSFNIRLFTDAISLIH